MKRWALTIAAGPKYSSSAQNTGQEVVQAALGCTGGVVEALPVGLGWCRSVSGRVRR